MQRHGHSRSAAGHQRKHAAFSLHRRQHPLRDAGDPQCRRRRDPIGSAISAISMDDSAASSSSAKKWTRGSLNKRVLESLVKSGALDSLGWKRSQCMAMIDVAIEYGQKARRDRESGQKGLFAGLSRRTVCHTGTGSLRICRNGRWKSAWRWKRKRWDFMFPDIRWTVLPRKSRASAKRASPNLIGEGKSVGLQNRRYHHRFPPAAHQEGRPDGRLHPGRSYRGG